MSRTPPLAALLARVDALPPTTGAALGLGFGGAVTAALLWPGHVAGAIVAGLGIACAFGLTITGRPRWVETASSPEEKPEPPVVEEVLPELAPPEPAAPLGPRRVHDPILEAMIELPGGTFVMGSLEDYDERPPHPVSVSPFALGETTVTVAQWNAVRGAQKQGDPQLPVRGVSWEDAVAFCNGASEVAGLRPAYVKQVEGWRWDREADGYRLPTEAEWEYAARAGATTRWPGGDDPSQLGEVAWYGANSESRPHPVRELRPNPWGIYDMLGNVWEWCWDAYDAEAYARRAQADDLVQDPVVESVDNVNKLRVLRGGSAWSVPVNLRFSDRYGSNSWDQNQNFGFRCARGPRRQP